MSNNQNVKYYTVYMPWIAVKLRERGYRIVQTKVNKKKPQFDCYKFKVEEGFFEALTEITQK